MENLRFTISTLTLFIALLVSRTSLQAQGTAFTYQGWLTVGTNVANGRYDLRFGLFDAVSSGAHWNSDLKSLNN